MKMRITSKVYFEGLTITDTYDEEFDDKINVFGKVLQYRERMKHKFPDTEFELVKTEAI